MHVPRDMIAKNLYNFIHYYFRQFAKENNLLDCIEK